MEAKKKEKLPNLKICIDNTESDDEKYDTLSIHDNDELDVDVDSDENFGSDNEKVEFNIRLGNVPKSKTPVSVSSRIVERKSDEGEYSSTSSDAENVEFNVRLGNVPKRRPNSKAFEKPERRYENKGGEFVTGIDVTGKNEVKKKYERAKRFGLEMKKKNHGLDLAGLYHSLGINEKKLNQDHRGIRLEAIHFRGTDTMHTKDVFGYFSDYGPGNVEWIDDQSCNVVWQEPLTAARAMLNLSKSYDSLMKESDGSSNDERSDTEENPNKTENSVKKKKQKKKRIKRDSSSSSSSDSSSSDEDDGNKKQKKKKSETKTKEKVKVADKMKVDKNMKDEQNKKLAKSSEKSVDNNRKEEKMEEEEDVLDLMDDDDKDKVVNESGDTEKKAESVNKENTQTGSTDKKSSRKSRKDKSSKPKKSRKASSSSSSSGSSSSRSSSSSSSSRSGSSSSGSSSSSSSSSSSGSSNSSSSSSSDEEEPKKTGAKSEKKEKEKEKVPQKKTKEKKSKPTKKKVLSIPWPPGKWRFGNSHSKAKYLFLRYATKADKKLPGAEKRSKFYQKYGNPNFGGAKGLISSSRKRKFRAEVNREEMAEARAVVKAQRATITYDDFDIFGDETASIKMETDIEEFGATVPIKKRAEDRLGAVENTDIETGEFEEGEIIESEGDVPKQPEIDDFNDDLDLTEDKKEFEVDEEAAMMEQELNILLASPPRKRSMRMYADDMEDEIVAKRSSKIESSDPPRTDSSRPDSSRPRDARSLIIGKSFETKPDRSSASDLRNKLKRNRKSPYERYSSYDRHHKMRIEVRD